MTVVEKILQAHLREGDLEPGNIVVVGVDVALGNDITAPIAIKKFREAGGKEVFDRNRVVLVADHFVPNKDIKSAEQCRMVREFAREQKITNYFEIGWGGIEHVILPEKGLVLPGELIVGADSHTCTYGALGAFSTGVGSTDLAAVMLTGEIWLRVPQTMKFIYHGKRKKWVGGKDFILYTIGDIGVDGALYRAMEFCGEAIETLPMADRFTMTNMAIEAGAKCGIIAPDRTTEDYLRDRVTRPYTLYFSDREAFYVEERDYDVGEIEPQVAFPHLPSNVKPVQEATEVEVDQVVIGSCTNGRLDDLRIAAEIIRGKKVAPYLRLIVIPGSQEVYRQALQEGLIEVFIDAGGVVAPPTCGPCLGGHMGVLGKGERALATTNRNFVGRMGDPTSEVYLAGPAVAAATAVKGRIAHPEEVC